MALTASQLIDRGTEVAKVPGMRVQAGQILNRILQNLCLTYDFVAARGYFTFNFNSVTGNGIGPYTLPADWLRVKPDDTFYLFTQLARRLQQIPIEEFDWLKNTLTSPSLPAWFTTDVGVSPPQLFVWPPPGGSYAVAMHYYKLMPDIPTPESSSTVPWFPEQTYLHTRLAGELMQISDDTRAAQFLSDTDPAMNGGFPGAGWLLKLYLKSQDDRRQLARSIQLDPQLFRTRTGRNLRPSKQTVY
jgi:hypothetical protein